MREEERVEMFTAAGRSGREGGRVGGIVRRERVGGIAKREGEGGGGELNKTQSADPLSHTLTYSCTYTYIYVYMYMYTHNLTHPQPPK